MTQINYMNKYGFNLKKAFINLDNDSSNYFLEYNSEISLERLDENDNENFNIFQVLQKNIKIVQNGFQIEYPEITMNEIFSFLLLYFDKPTNYCKILNKSDVYKIYTMVERIYLKNEKELENLKYLKQIIENEKLLFQFTNKIKIIEVLFRNIFLKSENRALNKNELIIKGFLKDIKIPIKITKTIDKNSIIIQGEIDFSRIDIFVFMKKLKETFREKIKNYEFSYELKIDFFNNKIQNMYSKTYFKFNKKIEIFELYKLENI